jgi:hypothetical protein
VVFTNQLSRKERNNKMEKSQNEFIRDFEIAFTRDGDGVFMDLSKTHKIEEWYANHITTVSRFEGVVMPAPPRFSENIKRNDDVARGLYLFGLRYYNELIENNLLTTF